MALIMPGASTPAGKLKLVGLLIDTIQAYIDQLPAGAPSSGADMLAAIAKVAALQAAKPRFLDVLAAKADVNDLGSQALVSALVTAVQAAPATDAASLTTAIANVLDGDPPVAVDWFRRLNGLHHGAKGRCVHDRQSRHKRLFHQLQQS